MDNGFVQIMDVMVKSFCSMKSCSVLSQQTEYYTTSVASGVVR